MTDKTNLTAGKFSHYINLADLHGKAGRDAKQLGEMLYTLSELQSRFFSAQHEFDEACNAMRLVSPHAAMAEKGNLHLRMGHATLALQAATEVLAKRREEIQALRESLAGTQWMIDEWYTETNPEQLKRSHVEEQTRMDP